VAGRKGRIDAPSRRTEPDRVAAIARQGVVVPPENKATPAAALISYASNDVEWRDANDSYAVSAAIRDGETLSVRTGSIEIAYASGARLWLTGPSEFAVQENGGTLLKGEIVARVPEAGHGFTIETPHGTVVDRGTEFGVVVDDFGVSEVSVFEGHVEAFPHVATHRRAERIDLTTGRTLQWSGDAIISMASYAREAQRPRPSVRKEYLDRQLWVPSADAVRVEEWQADRWRLLGPGKLSADGIQLPGGGVERSYVLSQEEYSTAEGPLTVSCEIRFRNVTSLGDASFSLLTRCADERSLPGTPWEDLLASAVRCTLRADGADGEGLLETGVKYESDRELSAIGWGGFVRPQRDVVYRLEMRDDGLNVSFTASLADDPTVSKTVTCRSLFRGRRDFIALEGCAGADVEVSQLHIVRAGFDEDPSHAVARSDAELQGDAARHGDAARQRDRLLQALVPDGLAMVVHDAFEGESLDEKMWTTLGDVTVADGKLRLGATNPQQHIDTWRPRPYLLSKKRFAPRDAELAITGTAVFAPNFLHGYGGSFAVWTRSEAQYGAGVGWEQSALRRGLRANFWPAALGQKRSVELFEMLSPEPINMLATSDFQIDPESRVYLFGFVDDGRECRLTLVDAARPSLRKTIAHPSESPALTDGHVAFEGCWGAPVLLDDLRIYQRP
ncbi:MAG: FecR domain-containing protein, partial [Planctomycetales bacterium]|nr:FecR domain-containing protein [Planctomycetales bacterium]